MGNPYAPPSGDRRDPDVLPPGRDGGPGPGSQPPGPHPAWPPQTPAQGQGQGQGHGQGQPAPGGAPSPGPSPSGPPQPGPPPWGSPQPGPGQPVGPPQRPEPDPAAVRATSRRILHFGVLLLAAVLTTTLPLPWQAASLVFVVVALVVGIRAFVLAWRGGVRGAVLPMLGLGVASAGLVAVTVLSLLVVWPQQLERQECLAGAVTIAATERCEAEFRRSLEERLDPARSPGGS